MITDQQIEKSADKWYLIIYTVVAVFLAVAWSWVLFADSKTWTIILGD